jgi:hypothetical protein
VEKHENFFMNIVACGETWLYSYDPETEQISTNNFITMTQDNVPSLMQDRGDSCSFFIQEVVIHHECYAQNQIVHQQFIFNYEDGSLIQFALNDSRKGQIDEWKIYHNTTHTKSNHIPHVCQPPYSTDMAPCDFSSSPK